MAANKIERAGRAPFVLGGIVLAAGLLLLFFAVRAVVKLPPASWRIYTEATISRIEEHVYHDNNEDKDKVSTTTYVSYWAEGRQRESALDYTSSLHRVGNTLRIYYIEGRPNTARTDLGDWMVIGILFLFGIPLALAGRGILSRALQKNRIWRLVKKGTKLKAAVVGTEPAKKSKYGDYGESGPCVLLCRAADPKTGRERIFKSSTLSDDPTPLYEQGVLPPPCVYINPRRPRSYYVDVRAAEKQVKD